jgi:hypothetical protein
MHRFHNNQGQVIRLLAGCELLHRLNHRLKQLLCS